VVSTPEPLNELEELPKVKSKVSARAAKLNEIKAATVTKEIKRMGKLLKVDLLPYPTAHVS
jgi:hypothetical protein